MSIPWAPAEISITESCLYSKSQDHVFLLLSFGQTVIMFIIKDDRIVEKSCCDGTSGEKALEE